LAYFLYFRLLRLNIDARLITITGSTSLFEQLAQVQPADILIAIEFFDVPKEIGFAIEQVRQVGAKVLGVTYPPTSAIGQKADLTLLAKRGDHRMVQSLTAPFCLLNALAISVATAKKTRSLRALARLDKMAENYWRDLKR
jgi:DNA-binding MurR/RpiR family transcriptional regulator